MKALVITVVVTILVVTVGMLVYMSFMSADRNGWRTLAKSFRLRDRPDHGTIRRTNHHFRTAVLNGFAFHGILVIGVSDAGLILQPIWFLRAFNPTLLLPWEDLTATTFQRTHHQGVRVELRDSPGLILEWSESTHRLVAKFLPDTAQA